MDIAAGYSLEEYFVKTDDGYILKLFRVPGSFKSHKTHGKRVVFLMHGLMCSSNEFLLLGPGNGIVYLLADAGNLYNNLRYLLTESEL